MPPLLAVDASKEVYQLGFQIENTGLRATLMASELFGGGRGGVATSS